MAEVFKAKSYGVEGFEKVIAIKRILPSMGEDRDFIKMFIDEAKIVGQLAHANICQIFELGRTDGAHFIAMEYIWGKDLLQIQNRLRKLKQQMPAAMACFLVAKVCEGLDYAHKKRDALGRPLEIVHRDCSPQNILISYEGEVKIIDFGIAKAASRSSKTQAGVLKGKFGYMSPEQVRGLPLDRRSDLFSVGTILYECLTGERLFVGETDFSTLEKVRNVDVPPPRSVNPSIPEEVERIIMKSLARDAEDRYQWCSEMVADLQRYLMSQDNVFTAKSLATWLKDAFGAELDKERHQLETFKKVGREGLIAGVPQAEAKLDVVEHLGVAGQAEDPTILGGPSFEDMIADAAAGNLPAAGSPPPQQHAQHNPGDEFVEEGPTEIFGEISEVAEQPVATPAAGAPAVVVSPSVRRPSTPAPGRGTQNMPAMRSSTPPPAPVSRPDDATISPLGMPAGFQPPPSAQQQQLAAIHASAAAAIAAAGPNNNAKTLLGMAAPVLPLQPPPTGQGAAIDPQAGMAPPGFPSPDQFPLGSHPPHQNHGAPGGAAYGGNAAPFGGPPQGQYPYQGQPPYGQPQQYPQYPPPGQQPHQGQGQPYPMGNPQQPYGYPQYGQYPGMPGYGAPTGPAPVDTTSKRRKKPSLAKDIGIGIGIAAVVLGAFAIVKFVVLADEGKPTAGTAAADTTAPGGGTAAAPAATPDAAPAAAITEVDAGTAMATADGDAGAAPLAATDAGTEVATTTVDAGAAPLAAAIDAGTAGAVISVDAAVKVAATETKLDPKVTELKTEVKKDDRKRDERKREPRSETRIDLDEPKAPKTEPKTEPKITKTEPKAEPKADTNLGYLTAYATPFAQVAVDGKPTGKTTPITPMGKIPLSPGIHKVTFSVGREKFTYVVKIEAGKTSKITKDLPVSGASDEDN